MHAVDLALLQRGNESIQVVSHDAPVLSAVGPRIDPSESVILIKQQEPAEDVRGVAFNLWNNAWSTNYMFFYPYHKADADISYDFSVQWP